MDLQSILATVRLQSSGAAARLRGFLGRLGAAIGRGPSRVLSRVRSMWSNNIDSTETMGQMHDRQDNWYQWRLGATEKHCKDCAHLNGQIHRASDWRAAGIRPQSPDLECGGWNCDCRLVPVPDYTGEGDGKMEYWRG